MKSKVCLRLCSNFNSEVKKVITSEKWKNVEMHPFGAKCGCPPLDENQISSLKCDQEKCSKSAVIGSSCLVKLKNSDKAQQELNLYHVQQCFSMFCDQTIIDKLLNEGAYLTTSGWLTGWRNWIKIWGFDKKTARQFFNESIKKIVLIDTGVNNDVEKQLKEFASFVNLPYEIVWVGLDFFRHFLSGIVNTLLHELEIEKLSRNINKYRKQSSELATSMDMLGKITQSNKEEYVIDSIFDFCELIFAPDELSYLPVKKEQHTELRRKGRLLSDSDSIRKKCMAMTENYSWSESGSGFFLRIKHFDETVGVLQVDHIKFPEYREHYLNLALSIVDICGLAIVNTRKYEEIKHGKEQQILISRVLEMFLISDGNIDEIHEILLSIRDFSGVEAIGIRLKKGKDFPYYELIGFDENFLTTEKYAGVYNFDGEIKRNSSGEPVLECLCGIILNNKTDSNLPCFTENGSFWTNNSSDLFTESFIENLNTHIRGRCITEGYESIALIPLFANNEIIGLIHLNDKRKNLFSIDDIYFFEKLSISIGIALERKRYSQSLRQLKSRPRHQTEPRVIFWPI